MFCIGFTDDVERRSRTSEVPLHVSYWIEIINKENAKYENALKWIAQETDLDKAKERARTALINTR